MSDDDFPTKEPGEKCNARKTDGSGYCRQPAGFGTDHVGHGRCKFHGGNTENQEKNVAGELEDASEHAAVALRLRLKHLRQRAEAGEDVDATELNKLAKTVLDRSDHGPTETREVTGGDGAPIEVAITREVVTDGDE